MLRVFERDEGPWVWDARGGRYFDLCSSMWQVPLGHGRDDIPAAMAKQARNIATAGPIFFHVFGFATSSCGMISLLEQHSYSGRIFQLGQLNSSRPAELMKG